MMEEKTYIIDPFSTLCKIALLYFLPSQTKLSISNHVLNIQESTCYQWLERKKNRDTRFDISNLNSPIIKAIKWYIIDNPERIEMDDTVKNSFKTITEFSIQGLEKLQSCTYKDDLSIKIILQYFINILNDSLIGLLDESKCVCIDNTIGVLSDTIKNNIEFPTVNTIAKNFLDAKRLSYSHENVNAIVECIHKILLNQDTTFIKLMKDINTNF